MSDELVERLREPWFTNGCERYQLDAADRIEALTAERDGYRKALEGLMAHEPDYSDTLWQDARAALKGESHE